MVPLGLPADPQESDSTLRARHILARLRSVEAHQVTRCSSSLFRRAKKVPARNPCPLVKAPILKCRMLSQRLTNCIIVFSAGAALALDHP